MTFWRNTNNNADAGKLFNMEIPVILLRAIFLNNIFRVWPLAVGVTLLTN